MCETKHLTKNSEYLYLASINNFPRIFSCTETISFTTFMQSQLHLSDWHLFFFISHYFASLRRNHRRNGSCLFFFLLYKYTLWSRKIWRTLIQAQPLYTSTIVVCRLYCIIVGSTQPTRFYMHRMRACVCVCGSFSLVLFFAHILCWRLFVCELQL